MKTKWYNFGLELSLLLAIFVTPLVFAPQLNVTFEFIKVPVFRSLVLIGLIFWSVTVLAERRISLPRLGWLQYALCGYFAITLLASLLSVAPAMSFWGAYFRAEGAYTFLHYGLFLFLLLTGVRNDKQIGRLLYAALCSGVIVAILGILQFSVEGFLDYWNVERFLGRIFSTMGHPNYLALFIVMLAPLSFAFYLNSKGWRQWLFLGIFMVGIGCLFLTLSRAGFLALLVSGIFFLGNYAWIHKSRKLFWTAVILPVMGIGILLSVNVFSGADFVRNSNLMQRLVFAGENSRSVETRLAMWPAVWKQVTDRPILGYGPDTLSSTFPKYAPKELLKLEDLNSRADRVHNEILDTLVSTGFLGLLMYLSVLIGVFVVGIRQKNIIVTGLLSGIIAYTVANQFGFPLVTHYVYLWLFAGLILLISIKGRVELSFGGKGVSKGLIALFVVFCSGYLIFSHNVNPVKADYRFRQARAKFNSEGAEGVITGYKEAILTNPHQSFYSYACANLAIAVRKYEDAEACLEKGGEFTSYNDQYYFHLGRLQAKKGENFDPAFAKATEFAPTYPYSYLEWGVALYGVKQYARSIEKFEAYLGLLPDYWKWKFTLGERSFSEKEKYRIFYKLNPDFDAVFEYLSKAYSEVGKNEQSSYYGRFGN